MKGDLMFKFFKLIILTLSIQNSLILAMNEQSYIESDIKNYKTTELETIKTQYTDEFLKQNCNEIIEDIITTEYYSKDKEEEILKQLSEKIKYLLEKAKYEGYSKVRYRYTAK
jgi:hypothetical protein